MIEPGETDLIAITFLLPCSEAGHIRVATDIISPRQKGEEELAWKARSFADVARVCEKRKDSDDET
jgi:hypothetical protein